METAQSDGRPVCFVGLKGQENTNNRPVRIGRDEDIMYDYVVRIKHAKIC